MEFAAWLGGVDLTAWLGMALRWLHVITGIAWIGSSFYFIWLDNSLRPPADAKDKELGVGGELWAVHGGGFYHKKKYQVAPAHMPEELHWFKWEAYFTWMSGFLLLALMYYYGANQFLIDTQKLPLEQWQAVALGLAALGSSWVVYHALCETPLGENNRLFGVVWFLLLTGATYVLTQIFSDRGAFIHIGAMIGTVMAANVFLVIIPNQKIVVADLLAGRKPDPALGKMAKQRSLHNNYMTLPVLLLMISNHYPMLFAHDLNWLLLAGIGIASLLIRHFFNLEHRGVTDYRYPAAGVAVFLVVMLIASIPGGVQMVEGEGLSDAQAMQIIKTHCTTCHSATPTHELYSEAPAGALFDRMEQVQANAERIHMQAVATDIMPLGNETGMTEAERARLGEWLKRLQP